MVRLVRIHATVPFTIAEFDYIGFTVNFGSSFRFPLLSQYNIMMGRHNDKVERLSVRANTYSNGFSGDSNVLPAIVSHDGDVFRLSFPLDAQFLAKILENAVNYASSIE